MSDSLAVSTALCSLMYVAKWCAATYSAHVVAQVERNGFHSGGWAEGDRGGGPGAGKQRGPAGVVAIRTDDGEQGASYAGISPDSVGAGQDLANGMASPARRHPSGTLFLLKTHELGVGPLHIAPCLPLCLSTFLGICHARTSVMQYEQPFSVWWDLNATNVCDATTRLQNVCDAASAFGACWTWEQSMQRQPSYCKSALQAYQIGEQAVMGQI